jgi:hypothetical protein
MSEFRAVPNVSSKNVNGLTNKTTTGDKPKKVLEIDGLEGRKFTDYADFVQFIGNEADALDWIQGSFDDDADGIIRGGLRNIAADADLTQAFVDLRAARKNYTPRIAKEPGVVARAKQLDTFKTAIAADENKQTYTREELLALLAQGK